MSTNPYPLAASLARPVARGWLSQDDAEDSILIAALRDRSGHDPLDVYRIGRHILSQRLAAEHARRDLAGHHIRRKLWEMIEQRQRARALLAEAHGVNGDEGFPLTEDEVSDIAITEMQRAARFAHVR